MVEIIEGRVQRFYIYHDQVALSIKSRIPAQQIKCWVNGIIIIGVFTIVKVEQDDFVKIVATVNEDGTYTAHALLNLTNYILHMHPNHGNSLKQTFAEVVQLGGVGGLVGIILMSLFFSIAHYSIYHKIAAQPFYTALIIGLWGALLFLVLGIFSLLFTLKYPIQTRQIFELLDFPCPAQLSMFKNINHKSYKVQWLKLNCHYQENKKRFLGVFDCHEVFDAEIDQLINKNF